jgi:hypothetical protein
MEVDPRILVDVFKPPFGAVFFWFWFTLGELSLPRGSFEKARARLMLGRNVYSELRCSIAFSNAGGEPPKLVLGTL